MRSCWCIAGSITFPSLRVANQCEHMYIVVTHVPLAMYNNWLANRFSSILPNNSKKAGIINPVLRTSVSKTPQKEK